MAHTLVAPTYEYTSLILTQFSTTSDADVTADLAALNDLGVAGWHVVAVFDDSSGRRLLLERPL